MLGILAKVGLIPIIVITIVIGGLVAWFGRAPTLPKWSLTDETSSMVKSIENFASNERKRQSIIRVCQSPECLDLDQSLTEKVDESLNPCNNFYEYVCNKYDKSNQLKIDEIHAAQKSIVDKLFQIVQEPVKDADIRPLQMTKQMYKACSGRYSNIEELKNFIKYIGGWSLLDNKWNETDFTLDKFYSRSVDGGYFPMSLFAIGITPDLKNNSRNTVFITQAKSADDLMHKIFRTKWPFESSVLGEGNLLDYLMKSFAVKISKKLRIGRIEVQKQLIEYIRLFGLIYAIYIEDMEISNGVSSFYNVMTLAQIETSFANIPWSGIIRGVFKPIKIASNEIFIVTCPQCLSMLNNVIGNVPKKSLVNFLMWSLVIDKIGEVDSEMLDDWISFSNKPKSPKDLIIYRESYCANKMFSLFRRVMDYEYINRHFDKDLLKKVTNFVDLLRNTMKDVINDNSVMDITTRAYAIQKVNSMVTKIAYDDEVNDKNKLNEYYQKLYIIDPRQCFVASLNLTKFITDNAVRNFRKPAEIDYLSATSGNAAYVLLSNAISSVLGGRLFAKNRPEYLNFGALGFIIGHEMNHGFDIMGRSFDMHGSLSNWWQPETESNYWEKVNCFVKQYSEYVNVETGNKVNGNRTLSENLADNGGIEIAYKAYVKWSENAKEELSLPSFQQYTPRQMFWMSFASITCSKISQGSALKREQKDVHALNRIRVNGVVSNSEDFAKDFQCESGTPMNPKKKCTVWS